MGRSDSEVRYRAGGGLFTGISYFADDCRLHGLAELAMRPRDGLQMLLRVLWLRCSFNKAALANSFSHGRIRNLYSMYQ